MAELVPTSWKNNLAHLRDGINSAFDRWLDKKQSYAKVALGDVEKTAMEAQAKVVNS